MWNCIIFSLSNSHEVFDMWSDKRNHKIYRRLILCYYTVALQASSWDTANFPIRKHFHDTTWNRARTSNAKQFRYKGNRLFIKCFSSFVFKEFSDIHGEPRSEPAADAHLLRIKAIKEWVRLHGPVAYKIL